MTRFVGFVGIKSPPVETSPGIYTSEIEEVEVTGELQQQTSRYSGTELAQDTIKANHILAITEPEEAMSSFANVAYVTWQNMRWVVVGITYDRPKIKLTLGGIYNG